MRFASFSRNAARWQRFIAFAVLFIVVACVAISFLCGFEMANAAVDGSWSKSLWFMAMSWVWIYIGLHIIKFGERS